MQSKDWSPKHGHCHKYHFGQDLCPREEKEMARGENPPLVVCVGLINPHNPSVCSDEGLTLEALKGRGGSNWPPPLDFFGFKFLPLDRLSKALAQLFLVCEHIFWHYLSDVISDDVIEKKSRNLCVDCEISIFRLKLTKYQESITRSVYLTHDYVLGLWVNRFAWINWIPRDSMYLKSL